MLVRKIMLEKQKTPPFIQSSSKDKFLQLAELYVSIQGEGSHSGLPCYFVRTAICDIRCTWCDTPHALGKGKWIDLTSLLDKISKIPKSISLIQITGGEPLIQKKNIVILSKKLSKAPFNKKIIIETGGHLSLSGIPENIHLVMDIKLPSSGEEKHDFAQNFTFLKSSDEIKFVVQTREDFLRALLWVKEYKLDEKYNLLFSTVWNKLPLEKLAEWMLQAKIKARLQTQLHKLIWGNDKQSI